jgi:hypothetical protein
MGEVSRLANLARVLLSVRVHGASINGSRVREVRQRIGFACEQARRRRAGEAPLAYDEYLATRQAAPLWQRLDERLDTYAMGQYRRALAETLGGRSWRGYARLAWAAICSPARTTQRLSRWLSPRHDDSPNLAPAAEDATAAATSV